MSDNPTSTSGAPDSSSGTNPENSKDKDTVAYSTYSKLLGEKKKRDEELEATKAKLAELAKAEKERTEKELKEKEDFKTLLKLREDELAKTKSEVSEMKSSLESGSKLRSFLDKVNGVVDKQYWALIDLDQIKMDPTTGMPDEMSVEAVAKKFEQDYGLVLKSKGAPKQLPNDAAKGGATSKMSVAEWKALKDAKKMKDNYHLVDWST